MHEYITLLVSQKTRINLDGHFSAYELRTTIQHFEEVSALKSLATSYNDSGKNKSEAVQKSQG